MAVYDFVIQQMLSVGDKSLNQDFYFPLGSNMLL